MLGGRGGYGWCVFANDKGGKNGRNRQDEGRSWLGISLGISDSFASSRVDSACAHVGLHIGIFSFFLRSSIGGGSVCDRF